MFRPSIILPLGLLLLWGGYQVVQRVRHQKQKEDQVQVTYIFSVIENQLMSILRHTHADTLGTNL